MSQAFFATLLAILSLSAHFSPIQGSAFTSTLMTNQQQQQCPLHVDFTLNTPSLWKCFPKCLGLGPNFCLSLSYNLDTNDCQISSSVLMTECQENNTLTFMNRELSLLSTTTPTTSTTTSTTTTEPTTTTTVATTPMTTTTTFTTTTQATATTTELWPRITIQDVVDSHSSLSRNSSNFAGLTDGDISVVGECFYNDSGSPVITLEVSTLFTMHEVKIWGGPDFDTQLADIQVHYGESNPSSVGDNFFGEVVGNASSNPVVFTNSDGVSAKFIRITKTAATDASIDLCVAEVVLLGVA